MLGRGFGCEETLLRVLSKLSSAYLKVILTQPRTNFVLRKSGQITSGTANMWILANLSPSAFKRDKLLSSRVYRGFQWLVKTNLVPYAKSTTANKSLITLSHYGRFSKQEIEGPKHWCHLLKICAECTIWKMPRSYSTSYYQKKRFSEIESCCLWVPSPLGVMYPFYTKLEKYIRWVKQLEH